MHTKKEIDEMIKRLEDCYPEAHCSLEYVKDYELLFATRLAAQCTDARVNMITPELYGKYPTLQALADAEVGDIERIIHSCGFFHSKAKDIVCAAQMLVSEYGGKVPDTMEELLKLPGVGRKTANLVLGDVFNKPAVVVDTHCIRLSNRIGLVSTQDPVKIETELRALLPPDKSSDFCHRLVLHGREVCPARSPKCSVCCIRELCDTGKTSLIN
jgi:endonuclease-3